MQKKSKKNKKEPIKMDKKYKVKYIMLKKK